jgi:hypothetical protein
MIKVNQLDLPRTDRRQLQGNLTTDSANADHSCQD